MKLLVTLVVALFALTFDSSAQQINSMKQLTPDAGWVAAQNRLFWTYDRGQGWKEITPPHMEGGISAVFFLDTLHGWVVTSHYDDEANTNHFFIASTSDTGADWSSFVQLSTPEIDKAGPAKGSRGLNENAWLCFTDAEHGFLNLGVMTGSGISSFAIGVVTSDGGKTWKDNGTTESGDMLFSSKNDGWVASGDDGLSVTHNAAKSWQEVTLPAPKPLPKEANAYYKLPIFPESDHGFLEVEYSSAEVTLTALFSTVDGGRTWKLDRVLPAEQHTFFFVLNSEWKALALNDHRLVLSSPLTSSPPLSAPVDPSFAWVSAVSFLDAVHGWALVGGDGPEQLLSTSDSGATWTIITPGLIKGSVVGHPPRVRTPPLVWKPMASLSTLKAGPSRSAAQAKPLQATANGVSKGVSIHLGFDKSKVMTPST